MDELHFSQRPHDALFRAVFGDPDNAGELLRCILPAEITAAINWRTLRRIEGSFVDEALRDQHADVLLEAELDGTPTLIYILNEHKSVEDRWTALQMLRYVVAIWERFRREHPDAQTLPPVLPVVLHHGARAWQGPRDLGGLLNIDALPAKIAQRQLVFAFDLEDLSPLDDEVLLARSLSLRVLLPLLHLKHMREVADTAALLLSWSELFRQLRTTPGGRPIVSLLISYTATVSNAEPEHLRLAFHEIDPEMESEYMTTAQKLMLRGELAGKVQLILCLLEQRFGSLDEVTLTRIRSSSSEQLDQIARTILIATTLGEVFSD